MKNAIEWLFDLWILKNQQLKSLFVSFWVLVVFFSDCFWPLVFLSGLENWSDIPNRINMEKQNFENSYLNIDNVYIAQKKTITKKM